MGAILSDSSFHSPLKEEVFPSDLLGCQEEETYGTDASPVMLHIHYIVLIYILYIDMDLNILCSNSPGGILNFLPHI